MNRRQISRGGNLSRRQLMAGAAAAAGAGAAYLATKASAEIPADASGRLQLKASKRLNYPKTRVVDVEDRLAGVSFPDPYRWLEEDTKEVRDWQTAQAQLASETVREWPHFDKVKENVTRLNTSGIGSLPRWAGGRWFRTSTPEGAKQAVAIVSDNPTGEGRILFNPVSENREVPPFLSWISPSPDGRVLALGVCADGSENNTIRLIDVASGRLLPNPPTQTLMDGGSGGAQWLADSSGFYFTALTGTTHEFRQRAFLYDLASGAPARQVEVPVLNSRDAPAVIPASGGRWVVAVQRPFNPIPVAVLDLQSGNGKWRPFVTDVKDTVAGFVVGDRYIAVTDIGAPRGRVIAIPLTSSTPNDPSTWDEIVPESEAVIRSLKPVGDQLYVAEFVDTYARVRIFAADGTPAGEMPLPGRGALGFSMPLSNISAPVQEAGYLFTFSTLTSSAGIFLHRPGQAKVETVVAPAVTLTNAVVEDHWATSSDGTRIPYHILRLGNAPTNRPLPALLYAYGGFNAPWVPGFPGAMAAFAEAGGLFVHCHLRGGGEFGRAWWEGGRLKNKQNCYQDLYAIAEDLIRHGRTRPDMLNVTGGSNGGLMAGVVAVQRPDLWRVSVPVQPFLDIIGGCRDPYGRHAVATDFGDPDDPDEVRRMAKFSPYQMVKNGTKYPAIYIQAGDTDPRCPPWHARKFAARMQAAQGGDGPILLHVWENAGHGAATARHIWIDQFSETLSFVMQQCGMVP